MGASKSKGDSSKNDDKPVKIDKWDTSAVKNALDDAAKKVILENAGYKECHSLMDGRLLICTIAVSFAIFALIWDYFRPFPESRPVLIICVLSYFILMGVLTIYTSYRESGIFLVALEKDKAGLDPDNVWTLSSCLKKYDDTYHLNMTFQTGNSKEDRQVKISKSVANFFDEEGTLCFNLLKPVVEQMKQSLSTEKKTK